MVSQHYRWDFIGLSTDVKPTSQDNEKVTDGSTFYCSDTSKLYVCYNDTWYERKPLGTAGDYYTKAQADALLDGKQDVLTAGENITIEDESDALVISATDTTYSDFTGTDGSAAGTAGLVPAPATTDADKYLKSDGSWATVNAGPTVVQTTGTSTTDVMSQNATTSMVYADPSTKYAVQIGAEASALTGGVAIGYRATNMFQKGIAIGSRATTYNGGIGIGPSADAHHGTAIVIGDQSISTPYGTVLGFGAKIDGSIESQGAVALGSYSLARGKGAVALGGWSSSLGQGVMGIGPTNTSFGYNSSNYRLLTGLYDPQGAHDAATKGYVDPTVDSSAPTTATVGRLGQIFIDSTTESAYMCVAVDSSTPSYTWKQITA